MVAAGRGLHRQAVDLRDRLGFADLPPIQDVPLAVSRAAPVAPCRGPLARRTDLVAGGVPARLYRPADDGALGLLVWFHGGGFVLGSLDTHDCLCQRLAAGGGFAVLSIGYRLAPEHPFPAAVEDAVAAVAWAHRHAATLGCRPERLAVGGDSAGGNLATVATQHAGVPLVHQALVYPVTDCGRRSASYADPPCGFPLTASAMAWFVSQYLSGPAGTIDDPRASPLLAPDPLLARCPATLVVTAALDPLRDEGEAYAHRLAEAGVASSHVRFDGMPHGFLGYADHLDDGRAAITLVAAAVAAAMERAGSP